LREIILSLGKLAAAFCYQ